MPDPQEYWELSRARALDVMGPDGRVIPGEIRVDLRLPDCIRELKELLSTPLDHRLLKLVGRGMRVALRIEGREIVSPQFPWPSSGELLIGRGLLELRRRLESENLHLRCYGASLNVYARGSILRRLPVDQPKALALRIAMRATKTLRYSRSQGLRLEMGRVPVGTDFVDLFESGPDVIPASIDEQNRFFERWALGWGVKTSVAYGEAR